MAPIIVDTSGLYALVDRKDPHHVQAATFLKSQARAGKLLISNHIFDETMTTVKARLGMQAALQLGLRLRNSRFIEMVIFSPAEEQETWRIFSRYTDKAWSYTDCACLVLAQSRELRQAFTFDHHFAQMGLVMRP
ncbi:MAG: type II toxin-antitoxin system VapC family toxin [Anaerolineae bacterium]